MRFTTVLAAAAASTATASPSAKRIQEFAAAHVFTFNSQKTGYESFDIPFGKLTHFENVQITRLEVRGYSAYLPGIPLPSNMDITCQMYKDRFGVQPGSSAFTLTTPAQVSTNPVELGWILCYVNVGAA